MPTPKAANELQPDFETAMRELEELVERLEQVEVTVVQGTDRNLKITRPSDMDLARLFLAEEMAGHAAS